MSSWPAAALPVVVAAVASTVTLAVLLRHRRSLPLDAPNARSLHIRPVPRVGGIAVLAGGVAAGLFGGTALPGGLAVWSALGLIATVSLADDSRGVHPALRLPVHLVAALVAVSGLLHASGSTAGWVIAAGLVLGIAWSANAFNFMDGSDGLAAAMAIAGLAAYALGTPSPHRATLYWSLAGAVVPFAVVNFPPARVFLGDGGAVPLGFLAAVCGTGEWLLGGWPAWFGLLVFLPFLADATLTLIRRLVRRERVWEAHRDHFYQRLHRMGADHRGTLLIYGVLMAACAGSAVATLHFEPAFGWIVLCGWCVVLGSLYLGVDYHWRRRRPSLS
ncbi:MAG: glycosyltransferase family 4 protein [Casimicrobiaceae bacterium]